MSILEAEIQFAQKLAANEKHIRTKALKKLRKYISVRSYKDGFTADELLKLWKGLFYCLWMQDKPLLQEELSTQISTLIHSFHDQDGQFLYLESFLQTFKREWTGIDRLRMDKFYQLVRFIFRQTFELLRMNNWENGVVRRFLQLLTDQLLQSDGTAPIGLQFHILDLYMTELAAVGSAELTANQNLIFIEPFCRTAAKTKDRTLFSAICSSIFSTIIDQAPFAIEDLMRELNATEQGSDTGHDSEHDGTEHIQETISQTLKKHRKNQLSDNASISEDDDDDELHLNNLDTELQSGDAIGPVLQFDYAGLADKILELSSRSSTPSHNRQKLYRIIKVLRDLSEGIFTHNEYPEEVSTDEDDDMFGSRRRMKKRRCHMSNKDEDDDLQQTKVKKNKDLKKDDDEQMDRTNDGDRTKKQKRKMKKLEQKVKGEERSPLCPQAEDSVMKAETQSSTCCVKVTGEADSHSELMKQPSVAVSEQRSSHSMQSTSNKSYQFECFPKKGELDCSEPKPEAKTPEPSTASSEISLETHAKGSKKKKKKRLESLFTKTQTQDISETQQVSGVGSVEETTTITKESDCTIPTDKNKAQNFTNRSAAPPHKNGKSSVEDEKLANAQDSAEDDTIKRLEKPTDALSPANQKNATSFGSDAQVDLERKQTDSEITYAATSEYPTAETLKKKIKKRSKQKLKDGLRTAVTADCLRPALKKKNKKSAEETEATKGEKASEEISSGENTEMEVTIKKTRPKKEHIAVQKEETIGEVGSSSWKKKKRKIPVVFEFESDELEAAANNGALIDGFADVKKTKLGNAVEEPSTPLSTKMLSMKMSNNFITFQSNALAPTPIFCKTKGSSCTPVSSKKKSQTPKSESKKVTFGLKNNKTAEFRKTDSSLLVIPDGSSRVPFDPKQKPRFGVLKSPPTPFPTTKKKFNKKRMTSLKSHKDTPKRRPLAADFF